MKRKVAAGISEAGTSVDPVAADCREPEGESAPAVDYVPDNFDNEDLIREKAYALYEARGCGNGSALDDWLLAESMVRQGVSGGTPAF